MNKDKRLALRVTTDLWAKLHKETKDTGMSLSSLIHYILSKHFADRRN